MVSQSYALSKIGSAFPLSSYAGFKYPNLGLQGTNVSPCDQLRTGTAIVLMTQLYNDNAYIIS